NWFDQTASIEVLSQMPVATSQLQRAFLEGPQISHRDDTAVYVDDAIVNQAPQAPAEALRCRREPARHLGPAVGQLESDRVFPGAFTEMSLPGARPGTMSGISTWASCDRFPTRPAQAQQLGGKPLTHVHQSKLADRALSVGQPLGEGFDQGQCHLGMACKFRLNGVAPEEASVRLCDSS